MNPTREQIFYVALAAAVGCGLMAGLLFAFSNFVMNALLQQPAESGIRTMQAINALIQNPIFFILFFGTTLATAIIAFNSAFHFSQSGAPLLLVGSVVYLIGTFGITVLFNVPLNDGLARHSAGTPEAASFWLSYATQWLKWNHVRTITSLAAATILTWAISRLRLPTA